MNKIWNYIWDNQRILRLVIIFSILGFIIYSSSGNFKNVNKNMNKAFSSKVKEEEFENEADESSFRWIPGFILELLEANFSWFAIKEMSYWIGLTILSLAGYGFFWRLNHNLDMKELEIQKKIEEEERKKKEQEKKEKEKAKENMNDEKNEEIKINERLNDDKQQEKTNNLDSSMNKKND